VSTADCTCRRRALTASSSPGCFLACCYWQMHESRRARGRTSTNCQRGTANHICSSTSVDLSPCRHGGTPDGAFSPVAFGSRYFAMPTRGRVGATLRAWCSSRARCQSATVVTLTPPGSSQNKQICDAHPMTAHMAMISAHESGRGPLVRGRTPRTWPIRLGMSLSRLEPALARRSGQDRTRRAPYVPWT
jgi:hypothetical protein